MQRKSRILKSYFQQSRSGFAMIMAIFFMIIMATLMTAMLASSTETANRTVNNYLLEQGQLLAKSAVEVAILRVSGRDRTAAGCLTHIDLEYPESGSKLFDIDVDISYFGFGGIVGNCHNLLPNVAEVNIIATPESIGTMQIDIYVQSHNDLNLTEPIKFHRRTLQKL